MLFAKPSVIRKTPVNTRFQGVLSSGANYRIRTCDLLITNQLLYQLS